jgi:serine O-acetyltransferase
MISIDGKRYGVATNDKLSLLAKFLRKPGFRFMFLYRIINQFSKTNPLLLVIKIWYKNLQVKYGYQIPHTSTIGHGLYLGHYGNIVINEGTILGKNCNVAQGVTIGNVSRGKRKGCPTIGDRVWIGANAVVVGKIKIGNDVLVAPLTLVNFDVPDKAVVVGNPAKIISYNGSGEYVKNIVE